MARRPAGAIARRAQGDVDVVHGFGASVLGYARSDAAHGRARRSCSIRRASKSSAPRRRTAAAKRAGYAPLRWAVRRVRARGRLHHRDRRVARADGRAASEAARRTDAHDSRTASISWSRARSPARPTARSCDSATASAPARPCSSASAGSNYNKGFDVLAAALGRAAHPGAAARGRPAGAGSSSAPARSARDRSGGRDARLERARDLRRPRDATRSARLVRSGVVFVHPTRYEGSSLVTLEAMAHRRPVIATRAGGLPDKVHPGVNGWLVEPNDEAARRRDRGRGGRSDATRQ